MTPLLRANNATQTDGLDSQPDPLVEVRETMQTFTTTPAATVRRILLSYLADEATFIATAETMAREECFMEILERFLALQRGEEFDLFFSVESGASAFISLAWVGAGLHGAFLELDHERWESTPMSGASTSRRSPSIRCVG